jgi:hypothetical protein
MAFSRTALAAITAVLTSAASAQQALMSEDLVWKLLEIGRVVDPPKTAALFAPLQEKEPYQGVKTEREVKYGPAARHRRAVQSVEAGDLQGGPNGCARATMVPQHSHMSEVYSINAVGTHLTDEILDFVKTGQ